jgi:hypothetical protein
VPIPTHLPRVPCAVTHHPPNWPKVGLSVNSHDCVTVRSNRQRKWHQARPRARSFRMAQPPSRQSTARPSTGWQTRARMAFFFVNVRLCFFLSLSFFFSNCSTPESSPPPARLRRRANSALARTTPARNAPGDVCSSGDLHGAGLTRLGWPRLANHASERVVGGVGLGVVFGAEWRAWGW